MADVWVRLPLGALLCTPPCCNGSPPSWYDGRVGSTPTGGSAGEQHGTPTAERPSSNLGGCGFDSRPCYSANVQTAFGRAVVRRAACKAAARSGNVGSIPTRGAGRSGQWSGRGKILHTVYCPLTKARSSNGLGCQVVNLTTRVQLPYEPLVCGVDVFDTTRSSSGIGRQVLNL